MTRTCTSIHNLADFLLICARIDFAHVDVHYLGLIEFYQEITYICTLRTKLVLARNSDDCGISFVQVIWLQQFTSWDKWEEKLENAPCSDHTPYVQTASGTWNRKGGMFGEHGVEVKSFRCVSAMAFTKTLIPEIVTKRYSEGLDTLPCPAGFGSLFGGGKY